MWTSSSNSWTKYHPWAAGHPVARRFCRDQKTHPPIAGEIASDRWHWHLATQVGFRWIVATFFLRRFHVSSWAARHRARNALHLDSPDFGAHEGQQPGDGWKMLEPGAVGVIKSRFYQLGPRDVARWFMKLMKYPDIYRKTMLNKKKLSYLGGSSLYAFRF